MSLDASHVRIAIIGAGIGGISAGIALRRKFEGFDDFLILEKAGEIGGTWRDNNYPGSACDIGSHFYSLSTDLNPRWSTFCASAAELHKYWHDLVINYGLQPNIVSHTCVDKVEWDDPAQRYNVTAHDTQTGIEARFTAEIVVSAVGTLSVPAFPGDIPGKEEFGGPLFHSAQWRHDVDLRGKRVAVIGNGSSAAQIVPAIATDSSAQVINFARSKHWYTQKSGVTYPPWKQWMFAHVPLVMRLYRIYLAAGHDFFNLFFQKDLLWKGAARPLQGIFRKELTRYMHSVLPEEYRESMLPDYDPGCKRLVVDWGYLDCLKQSNVRLTFDKVARIEATGIRMKDNGDLIHADIIVFATGFDTQHLNLNVIGRNGITIEDYFDSQGGPTAYLGTTVPNFPNFFTLMGPNTVTGNTSVVFSEEIQINYIASLIAPILSHQLSSIEVSPSACDKYNAKLQRWLERTVWTGCASWYRAPSKGQRANGKENGAVEGKGKVTALFPGPLALFWWYLAWPKWDDYITVIHGGKERVVGRPSRRRGHYKALYGAIPLLAAAAYMFFSKTWMQAVDTSINTQSI